MKTFCGKVKSFILQFRVGGAGGFGGAQATPSFSDLFSKNFQNLQNFHNFIFFIQSGPPIKNLLPPTLLRIDNFYQFQGRGRPNLFPNLGYEWGQGIIRHQNCSLRFDAVIQYAVMVRQQYNHKKKFSVSSNTVHNWLNVGQYSKEAVRLPERKVPIIPQV